MAPETPALTGDISEAEIERRFLAAKQDIQRRRLNPPEESNATRG